MEGCLHAEYRFPLESAPKATIPALGAFVVVTVPVVQAAVAAVAEQLAVPLAPVQVQDQGPLPDSVAGDAVPTAQSPDCGAERKLDPLAVPHAPAPGATLALHPALVPPLIPVQPQVHGPEPITGRGLPAKQRPVVGFVFSVVPLVGPHWPFTGVAGALAAQEVVVPP